MVLLKRRRCGLLVALLAGWVAQAPVAAESEPAPPYVAAIEAFRAEVDWRFRDRILSPLPEPERLAFEGLHYYAVDPALALPAKLEPSMDRSTFAMPTFDRSTLSYSHFGTLEADIDGRPIRLQAFRREHAAGGRDFLLVPFRDATNGDETYSGGRYIEIPLPLPEKLVLDFNRSANPLCAYDSSYACPIPPRANHLPLPIRAGEKRYQ